MNEAEMTNEELSLLLYLESRAVDYRGGVDTRYMNSKDMEIVKKWNESGFVIFDRITSEWVRRDLSHACELSDEAWRIAHEERRNRAKRMKNIRRWKTIREVREQNGVAD